MKSPIKLAIATLALVVALPLSRAQETGTPPPPPPPPAGEHEAHPKGPRGENIKFLTEKLALTQDQQTKVKAILEDERKAGAAVRGDAALDKDAKRAKMMEIRKSHREQIRAVLTPEQQKKLDELKEEHGHGPGPGAPKEPKE
jgi:Spy/CpxP family protein refolding chaperone